MLTTVASAGLAADPALPSRDALLDADRVAATLSLRLGVGGGAIPVHGCELVRAKYRIGESLRVVYRLELGDRRQLVAARVFRDGADLRAFQSAASSAASTSGLKPVLHDAEHAAVWWTFPNDRRLRGVSDLLQPADWAAALLAAGARATAGLGEAAWGAGAAGRDDAAWVSSAVAEYAPERSVTLRASDAEGNALAYVKAYAPGTIDVGALSARYAGVAAALASSAVAVRSPLALGHSVAHNVLLLQAMPGVHWGAGHGPGLPESLRALGSAIATLHDASPAVEGVSHFGRLDLPRVVHSAELIGQARPDVGLLARDLGRRLATAAPSPGEQVLLHGDCHPKNALLSGEGVALIDLDQAGCGAAAADIGSLLARLRHGTLLGEHPEAHEGELAAAFLLGYAQVRPLPDQAVLRWHTAAALLAERAMRAVNRVHVPALAQLDQLLIAARRELSGGTTS